MHSKNASINLCSWFDIAVPRDIEPEISKLNDVYLYTVDDLETVIEENLQTRQTAALQADEIVITETRHFIDWMQSLDAIFDDSGVARKYADASGRIWWSRQNNVWHAGEDPEQVIEALARALTQKFTHTPSVKLKEATMDRQDELINAVKELFNL